MTSDIVKSDRKPHTKPLLALKKIKALNSQIWYPHVTVAAICERDGQFLLVEERSKSNDIVVLNQPAGHLDEDETLLEAVVRETREETCRHFVPEAIIGLYRLVSDSGKTYLRYTFCGQIGAIDKSLTLDPDIITTHWLTTEQIEAHDSLRSPLVIKCIEDYLAGIRHPLSLLKEI